MNKIIIAGVVLVIAGVCVCARSTKQAVALTKEQVDQIAEENNRVLTQHIHKRAKDESYSAYIKRTMAAAVGVIDADYVVVN